MSPALAVSLVVLACVGGFLLGRMSTRRRPVERPDLTSEPEQPTPLVEPPGNASADIERAVAGLRLGVVVVDGDGIEVYRNNRATEYATGRHGDALVEVALERVLEGALVGLSLEETIAIYGPPARSVLIQASPTYDGGVLSGAVGVIEDVTEARHTDRVRSDFVANVSHELRTPIGAISVLAETMADADDPEVVDRMAARMQREANRLSETITDLLALSRLESGPVIDPETIDLWSVVTMAIERTLETARQRRVLVMAEKGTDRPVLIDGDQGQLVAAVANLIDNGIKYSDPDCRVTVRLDVSGGGPSTQLGRVDGDSSDSRSGWAEVSVTDAGVGIPDRDQDRIFERFYRVDEARSRETGGSGLGLSIVRNALANHRGTVSVLSTEGQGSTFTIRLPLSASHAVLPPSGAETNPTTEQAP